MPSRPKYSQSLRNAVETCLCAAIPLREISREVHVSCVWVYYLKERLDVFDTVSPPHCSVQGRPRKIHQEAREGVVEFLE